MKKPGRSSRYWKEMRNSEGQRRTGSGRKRTPPLGLGLHLVGLGNPGKRSASQGTCWDPVHLLLPGGKREPVWFLPVGLQMPSGCSLQALHPHWGWLRLQDSAGWRDHVASSLHFSASGPHLFRTPEQTSAGRGSDVAEVLVPHQPLGLESDRLGHVNYCGAFPRAGWFPGSCCLRAGGPGREIKKLARVLCGCMGLRQVVLAAVWWCKKEFLRDLTNDLINKYSAIGEGRIGY